MVRGKTKKDRCFYRALKKPMGGNPIPSSVADYADRGKKRKGGQKGTGADMANGAYRKKKRRGGGGLYLRNCEVQEGRKKSHTIFLSAGRRTRQRAGCRETQSRQVLYNNSLLGESVYCDKLEREGGI